jgi:predicted amidohydrolase
MNIYCCQLDIVWEDKEANYRKVEALLAHARPQRNSLVLLPEMFATGFSMNVASIAEDAENGSTAQFLSRQAAKLSVFLVGGFATRGDDGMGRNVLAVFGPDGKRVVDYTKIHPFSIGDEHRHYAGGERVRTFSWPRDASDTGATVSPFICYDLRFPEIFRLGARAGAEVIAVIANWPQPRIEHWVTLLRARAIENQAYVAGVNRCGTDPKLVYPGRSIIVDPHGVILADAGSEECVITAAIDLPALRDYRQRFPVLSDMRPTFLGGA